MALGRLLVRHLIEENLAFIIVPSNLHIDYLLIRKCTLASLFLYKLLRHADALKQATLLPIVFLIAVFRESH